jgi:hypothetical protein
MPLRRLPLLAAVLCALLARPAGADRVTPDMASVPWDTPVTDQYKRFGLVFRQDWYATFNMGGWASGTPDTLMPAGTQSVAFVVPGTDEPATTDTLRLRISSAWESAFTLDAYDVNGKLLRSYSMLTEPGIDQWVSVEARGIHSFRADESWWHPPGSPPGIDDNSPQWWMYAVEFTPVAAAPEPGGLALFALGALGLAARARRKRPCPAGGRPC